MIKILRTKGLVLRHWRHIGHQLNMNLDPSSISLFKIIAMGLFEEDKLKIIKGISDVA